MIECLLQRAKMLKAKKEEGNEAFKAGRYPEALEIYTSALNIDANNKLTNAKLYNNRALVLVKVIRCLCISVVRLTVLFCWFIFFS